MEIILLVSLLVASPFGAALLADKPTQKRVARFVDTHWLTPLEEKAKPKSLAPSIIPAEYGKLEPKNKNTAADTKLAEQWKDAFDWFSIMSESDQLKKARLIAEEREDFVTPHREKYEYVTVVTCGGSGYGGALRKAQALAELEGAMKDALTLFPMTSEQVKALDLSRKYGWEMIDNDIIRLVRKEQMPTFDYIALTSV